MKRIYFITVALSLLFASCEEKKLEPITPSLGKPGVPTQISTEPISGGVIINYQIPSVEDILGVKAVYTLADGKVRETISSFYNNQITIEGYNDMQEYTATLYTINRALETSDPVAVPFTPLESSISKVIKTMKIERDFGGAQYTWNNEDRTSLTIEALTTDSLGTMIAMRVLTTATPDGVYNLRGYGTEARWFAALVRDNYNNVSDTIYPLGPGGERIQLSPMYEEKLDKGRMRIMSLDNDQSFTNFEGNNSYIIDDNVETFGHSANGSMPAAVTFDLGIRAQLSRVQIHQRNNEFYGWGNPRTFEVYACATEPDKNGDWSQWTKLLDCEIVKPSGLPLGNNTDEDLETAQAGHDFTFSLSQEPLRYIRIRFLTVWTSSTFCHPAEVTFYGDPNANE